MAGDRYAKILSQQGTPASLEQAAGQLEHLNSYFERIHNTRFLI